MTAATPAERVRTLLLRTDNLLKKGRAQAAREALDEARVAAEDATVDPRVRELVARRLASLEQISGS